MKKADAISKLKQHAQAVESMGATSLYLFGSTARDEAIASSDLDIFIDYDPGRRFSLLDLVGIKQFLEEELAVEVDVTTRNSLHPLLHNDIEQSAVRIF
ncbi:nucleotidyltransferase family protein [Agrobacterium pusense]|uniref:nucleotidyltransferase family protein n=1 Tax=Agrobacterium pusense TaxID=648995 RepID=UPI003FD09373